MRISSIQAALYSTAFLLHPPLASTAHLRGLTIKGNADTRESGGAQSCPEKPCGRFTLSGKTKCKRKGCRWRFGECKKRARCKNRSRRSAKKSSEISQIQRNTACDVTASCPDISNFGLTLFEIICAENATGNVLVSPFSVAQALALTAAGATKNSICESELLATLGIEDHRDIPSLTELLLSDASTYGPLNTWLNGTTKGLIQDLFEDGPMDGGTVAILLNAVYFRGFWTTPFDAAETRNGTFHERHKDKTTEFMNACYDSSRDGVLAVESLSSLGGASVVRLHYGPPKKDPESNKIVPSDFAALFILPAENTASSMAATVGSLATQSIADMLDSLMPEDFDLSLPRFKVKWGTNSLVSPLRALGVHDAFAPGSFLEISDDPSVYVSDVLHQAVMEVTEEGTTAAAATAVILKKSLRLRIVFDRPFCTIVIV